MPALLSESSDSDSDEGSDSENEAVAGDASRTGASNNAQASDDDDLPNLLDVSDSSDDDSDAEEDEDDEHSEDNEDDLAFFTESEEDYPSMPPFIPPPPRRPAQLLAHIVFNGPAGAGLQEDGINDAKRAEELMRGLEPVGADLLKRYLRAAGEDAELMCAVCREDLVVEDEREPLSSVPDLSSPLDTRDRVETPLPTPASTLNAFGPPLPFVQPIPPATSAEVLALPCRHAFHAACLHPWLSRRTTCPTCRLDLDPESLTLTVPSVAVQESLLADGRSTLADLLNSPHARQAVDAFLSGEQERELQNAQQEERVPLLARVPPPPITVPEPDATQPAFVTPTREDIEALGVAFRRDFGPEGDARRRELASFLLGSPDLPERPLAPSANANADSPTLASLVPPSNARAAAATPPLQNPASTTSTRRLPTQRRSVEADLQATIAAGEASMNESIFPSARRVDPMLSMSAAVQAGHILLPEPDADAMLNDLLRHTDLLQRHIENVTANADPTAPWEPRLPPDLPPQMVQAALSGMTETEQELILAALIPETRTEENFTFARDRLMAQLAPHYGSHLLGLGVGPGAEDEEEYVEDVEDEDEEDNPMPPLEPIGGATRPNENDASVPPLHITPLLPPDEEYDAVMPPLEPLPSTSTAAPAPPQEDDEEPPMPALEPLQGAPAPTSAPTATAQGVPPNDDDDDSDDDYPMPPLMPRFGPFPTATSNHNGPTSGTRTGPRAGDTTTSPPIQVVQLNVAGSLLDNPHVLSRLAPVQDTTDRSPRSTVSPRPVAPGVPPNAPRLAPRLARPGRNLLDGSGEAHFGAALMDAMLRSSNLHSPPTPTLTPRKKWTRPAGKTLKEWVEERETELGIDPTGDVVLVVPQPPHAGAHYSDVD
ncbi:hypothetical protein EXIGLDRAFT_695147 [Exidia glandulosa HHB12029]|uniref:RING-type domain-containing protein n=1 Tax=Exidia glandulosa HHB12029 TaxID=1314781 RepID=A0A165NE24_EXIGL|nr:hypothetical protein EXIGLDRAFT_695147 [Exidia glandulosa HHB12029]